MNTLAKPHFSDLPQGECAGAPILLKLWDRFDFSFLLTQSGINKVSGVPTWMTAFLYAVGLVANCASVAKMAELAGRDALLRFIFQGRKITQSVIVKIVVAFDQNYFITRCVNYDENKPGRSGACQKELL